MLERITVGLLAFVLLVTSGMTSRTAYLCLMDGQTRTECGCRHTKAEAKANSDCATLQRSDSCCEAEVTDAVRPPATTRDELTSGEAALPLLAILPWKAEVALRRAQSDLQAVSARGPPFFPGPALFVWNCSFLI